MTNYILKSTTYPVTGIFLLTEYIWGFQCSDNVIFLIHILAVTQKRQTPACIISLDAEKSFEIMSLHTVSCIKYYLFNF